MVGVTDSESTTSIISSADLPLSTHTYVLGVDIRVHQQAIHAEVHEEGYKGGLKPDVEITAWPDRLTSMHPDIRRDLAAWSRRNVFEGASPS